MRLPRESLLFLGILTASCLLGGVVFGIATGTFLAPIAPAVSATPSPAASHFAVQSTAMPLHPSVAASASPPGAQKSLLLIGVDDAQAATPQLESVWVLAFQPGVNIYYILAVPPSAEFYLASLSGMMTMRDIYREDQYQQVGYYFTRDAVESRFPGFSIEADVVLDRGDFVGLIGRVGGLSWAGQVVAGQDLLTRYDALGVDDNTSRMLFQQQVFGALCAALAQKGLSPADLLDYIRLLPQVTNDAARLAALDAFITGAPTFPDSSLNWLTFQPEMEIGSIP